MKGRWSEAELAADRARRPRKTERRRWTGLSRLALGQPEYYQQWKRKRRPNVDLSNSRQAK